MDNYFVYWLNKAGAPKVPAPHCTPVALKYGLACRAHFVRRCTSFDSNPHRNQHDDGRLALPRLAFQMEMCMCVCVLRITLDAVVNVYRRSAPSATQRLRHLAR